MTRLLGSRILNANDLLQCLTLWFSVSTALQPEHFFFSRNDATRLNTIHERRNKSVLQLKPVLIICSLSTFISLTSLLFISKNIMVRSVQGFTWEGVEVGQLRESMDFGKMAESQNKKIGPQ
jgi:hypothetical protein